MLIIIHSSRQTPWNLHKCLLITFLSRCDAFVSHSIPFHSIPWKVINTFKFEFIRKPMQMVSELEILNRSKCALIGLDRRFTIKTNVYWKPPQVEIRNKIVRNWFWLWALNFSLCVQYDLYLNCASIQCSDRPQPVNWRCNVTYTFQTPPRNYRRKIKK